MPASSTLPLRTRSKPIVWLCGHSSEAQHGRSAHNQQESCPSTAIAITGKASFTAVPFKTTSTSPSDRHSISPTPSIEGVRVMNQLHLFADRRRQAQEIRVSGVCRPRLVS
jgi:hypothetical protein